MKIISGCMISAVSFLIASCLLIPRQVQAFEHYGASICQDEGYTCMKVPKGGSWEVLFPDENQRAIVMRINRMNEPIYRGMVIAVPNNLASVDYMHLTPMPTTIEAKGYKQIIVNPNEQAFGAYDENGNLVRWGPVSAGRDFCPDIHSGCRSKAGAYKVYEKRGEGCFSSKFPVPYGGAPMPYCMFFNRGYAIHASELPGYNASHGCIRVFYEDALWLNHEFAGVGTPVIVEPYET